METRNNRIGSILLIILILSAMLILAVDPNEYMQSCLRGLNMWGMSVLPALFPFFFFSGLLTKMQVLDFLGKKLSKIMQFLFHTPGSSGIIYIFSIVSGYPVGAKITSELYQKGTLGRDEVVRINAFASTSGPLFVIGSIGVGMLYNHSFGIVLLASHLVGALLNGLLYRNHNYSKQKCIIMHKESSINSSISATMYDSIISILIVGGYIIIANIFIDMLGNLGILNLLAQGLNSLFGLFGCCENIGGGIASGIFEVTRGCKDLSSMQITPHTLLPLLCGLISWGGISIQLQALTFLHKCNISTGFYMLQKFTQAIISAIVCYVLCIFFV